MVAMVVEKAGEREEERGDTHHIFMGLQHCIVKHHCPFMKTMADANPGPIMTSLVAARPSTRYPPDD